MSFLRPFAAILFAWLLAASTVSAMTVSWSVSPSATVSVNQQYTVTATAVRQGTDSQPYSLTLMRFTSNVASGPGYASYTTSEATGGQTIQYAATVYWQGGSVTSYSNVVVSVPVQHPPSITWRLTPDPVNFGSQYRIEAVGQDADSDLVTVNIYRNGQPFAFALNSMGGGIYQGSQAWSGNPDTAPSVMTTIEYEAEAIDSHGNHSGWIYCYVHTKSVNAPTFDGVTLSNPYINQNTDIIVNAHDVDSDLKNIAIVTSVDNPLTPDSPSPGQYAMTLVGHNHQNPPLYVQFLVFWVWIRDWSGNETDVYTGNTITTDNRPVYVPTLTTTSTSLVVGQSVTLGSYLHDDDGNATQHTIFYRLKRPTDSDYGEWQTISNANYQFANGVGDNTISFQWTPPEVGQYQIKVHGTDPYTFADSVFANVVASAPPDTTPPDAPTGVTAGSPTLNTISLTWVGSQAPDVQKYRLFWGPVGGTQTSFDLGINVRGYTVTGLNPATNYQFFLRADDFAQNESGNSNVATATTLSSAADSDGDGLPNGWENSFGFNYLSPTGTPDTLNDPDNDGLTNIAEYNLGSDPTHANTSSSALGSAVPSAWSALETQTSSANAVGVTSGTLGVDASGAATYTLPIWTTPGTAGMEPKITLDYSSQGGASVAGWGWSIGGISAITRGPKQLFIDGAIHGVDFSSADQYYLDGQRLILISGVHGTLGAEYRTVNDVFTKVVVQGVAGNGPSWFKAWTKSGLVMEFGNPDASLASNSALTASGRSDILKWSVTRVIDTKGNFLLFKYDKDETIGEQVIRYIDYTCTGANPGGYASLEFQYETTRNDKFYGYLAGSNIAMTKRLTHIVSSFGPTPARDYALTYLERDNTHRSLLSSVQELGDSRITPRPQLPALTFNYQSPTGGWQTLSAAWTPPYPLLQDGKTPGAGFVDLDGDGRPDFVYFYRNGSTDTVAAYLNRSTGWVLAGSAYNPAWPLAIEGQADSGARFIDYNGDGLVDFVYSYTDANGVTTKGAYKNTGTGFVSDPTWAPPVPLARAGRADLGRRFIDVNGDGRVDLVYKYYEAGAVGTDANSFLNTGSGWQQSWNWLPPFYTSINGLADNGCRFIDLNGDGLVDQIQLSVNGSTIDRYAAINSGTQWVTQGTVTAGASNSPWVTGIPTIATAGVTTQGIEFTDINGDGLPDILVRSSTAGSAYLNTGTGWVNAGAAYTPASQVPVAGAVTGTTYFDVDGDGIADSAWYSISGGTTAQGVRLGTGTGWSGLMTAYNLPRLLGNNGAATGTDLVDLNGDGFADLIWNHRLSTGTTEGSGASLSLAKRADVLTSVVTGLGVTAKVVYKPLTDSSVYKKEPGAPAEMSTTDAAQVINAVPAVYVVSQINHDDGAGGTYPINYSYQGLRVHPKYGSLGFHQMEVEDGRVLTATNTVYRQDFPYIGMPQMILTTSSAGIELSKTVNSYGQQSLNSGKNRFVFVRKTVATSEELDGTITSNVTTTFNRNTGDDGSLAPFAGFDAYGNSLQIQVDSGDNYSSVTTNTYTNDATNWILGRLVTATVTAKGPTIASVSGHPDVATSMVRKSSFTYFPSGTDIGLLQSETVESSSPVLAQDVNLKVTTTYAYDAYGNKISAIVTGDGLVARTTTTAYGTNGRFPSSLTNAENQTETYNAYDDVLGVLKQSTGPNGLQTVVAYDGFGRVIQQDSPEGDGITRPTSANVDARDRSSSTYRWTNALVSGVAYSVESQVSGSAPSMVYYDAMGRAIASFTVNGGDLTGPSPGAKVVGVRTWYDSSGRVVKTSSPFYFTGGAVDDSSLSIASQVNTFDELNRPTSVSVYDDQNGLVTTTTSYSGLTATVTNALSQASQSTSDRQGHVISRIDNSSSTTAAEHGETAYVYDPLGNLVRTQVKNSNGAWSTTSVQYDTRGRKTKMVDPSMGTWSYQYDGAGDLIDQKDANGQEVVLTYDRIGRLTKRTEPEGVTTWEYDTAVHSTPQNGAPGVWIGKLSRVTGPTDRGRVYSESYLYDAAGRPTSISRVINGTTFTSGQSFDAYGRVEKVIYPNGFVARNVYNSSGFLQEVRDGRSSSTTLLGDTPAGMIYWQADHYSIAGAVDGAEFGNGLIYDRIISPTTGRVSSIIVGNGLSYNVQNQSYLYDGVGNVKQRSDSPFVLGVGNTYSRVEKFGYDGLNRLTKYWADASAPSPSVTVGYDALGNVTNKSDTGAYTYGGTSPNAVTGLAGGAAGTQSFQYDANGNMIKRNGSTISWTSYNQAKQIAQGSSTVQFWFDCDHQRVIEETSRGDTTYFAGPNYELLLSGGTLREEKCYIFTPLGRTAVRTNLGGSTIQTRWLHQDALGSIVAATDELGRIDARFSFDPWGKRAPASFSYPRGFTDHEMLDDVGLIHMNGRVYDPILGRFLSADPFVEDGGHSQSYNRYSYVQNNPLASIDPSGFFSFKQLLGIVAVIIVAVVVTIVTYGAATGATSAWFASAFGSVGSAAGTATAIGTSAAAGSGAALAAVAAGGFASGFAGSLLNGGSLGDAFKAGAVGALVSLATAGIASENYSSYSEQLAWKATAHGIVGGVSAELEGGDFRHGFLASAASAGIDYSGVGGYLPGNDSIVTRTARAAVIGGTVSSIGGGKFANGAVTAAIQHLFNNETAKKRAYYDAAAKTVVVDGHRAMNADQLEAEATACGFAADSVWSLDNELDRDIAAGNKFDDVMLNAHGGSRAFLYQGVANEPYGAQFPGSLEALSAKLDQILVPTGTIWVFVCEFGQNGFESAQTLANLSNRAVNALPGRVGYDSRGFSYIAPGDQKTVYYKNYTDLPWTSFTPKKQ